jgi:hypothetical protein
MGNLYFPFDRYQLATGSIWPPATPESFLKGRSQHLHSIIIMFIIPVFIITTAYFTILKSLSHLQTVRTYYDLIYMVSYVL